MEGASNQIETHIFEDDGRIPNNPKLPLLVYQGALSGMEDPESEFRAMLAENGWSGAWRNGVFPYHHYTRHRMRFSG